MRKLLRFKSDIPFAADDSNKFLPWIIAFIVFIASMMIVCGMGFYDILGNRQELHANNISVHIPDADDADQTAEKLISALKEMPGVQKVESTSPKEISEILKPWLGNDNAADSLPLPRVVNVTLVPDVLKTDEVKKKILEIAPPASVDDHADWLSQYTFMLTGLQWGLWIIAALFFVTTFSIVILTTRASIKIHTRVIHILHSIGALDSYIARQFQMNAFRIAAKGAMIGSIASLAIYGALCGATGRLQVPLLPDFQLGAWQVALYALLPFAIGFGALFSTRLTVLAELRRMP
jgi:cell division transport system permease protein